MLSVSASPLTRQEPPKLFNSSTDKYKFHNIVDQQIKLNVKLKTPDDIDLAVNNLTQLIQSSAWSSSIKCHPSTHLPQIPEYTRSIIVEKRRARALYQRTRLPSHKQKYNKLANHLKKVLAKQKSESLANFLSNLSSKDGSLWRETKKICKYKSTNLPIKNPDGSYVISDPDKAELFKTHLSDIFQPHPDIFSHTNNIKVNDYLNSPLCSPAGPVKHFTPNDIKFVINQCSLKKSPGYDLITAEVARCLPKRAIVHLSHIFNSILRLSHFPSLWKFSTIILVPKLNKPPDLISSFRPISLLPFFAKILEKLILKRILPSIAANSIIPNSQFGFRSAHSTIQQVHRVVDAISYSLEKKLYCTSVFLDVSQAFDRVWHDGLLFKLKKFLHPTYFLVIKSYLSDRNFQVRVGNSFSSIAHLSAGVPQGGILSPILYNIYASDQPTTPNTMVADYADDKAILSIHSDPVVAIQNLQSHLTLMEEWYTKWRVKINQSKSIHTTFTLRLTPCDDVFIYGTLIPSALSTKYLGLTLDKRITWAHHIKEKIVKLNLRLRLLKSLIFNNKYTHINTKLLIYKSLLKPIWTYGLQLWGNAKKSNLNKIQTFQNKALRNLLNAPPYVSNHSIRSDLKIPLVHDEAKSYYKRFHLRLPSHPNPLARDLSTLTIPGEDVKRKWKNIRDMYLKEKKKVKKSRSGDSQDNAQVYTGKWVYYHLLHFLKDTTTPRTTEGNVSDENETQLQMSDLSDSEEVNSFSSSFIDIEDIQSPENPVSVTQSECFTIPSTSNLSHIPLLRLLQSKENKSFESKLLKLETQKINALLESNKPQVQDDEDMMFLKSLHPYLKTMDNLQKLRVRNEIQSVLINQLSIKNQQYQNSNVPPAQIHELYIPQHIQQQITTNSSDNPTFIGYQQY
ncbi:hypothetical protein QTP88_004500 [Uroleucon formosanum]